MVRRRSDGDVSVTRGAAAAQYTIGMVYIQKENSRIELHDGFVCVRVQCRARDQVASGPSSASAAYSYCTRYICISRLT